MRTPTSTTDHGHSVGGASSGFTLVELLAVLAILALAVTFVGARSQQNFGSSKFLALVSNTVSMIRETRAAAIAGASERTFVVDLSKRRLQGEGSAGIDVPADVAMTVDAAKSETIGTSASGFTFFSDGSSTGGSLRLSWKDRNVVIDVNWLTGNVFFHAG